MMLCVACMWLASCSTPKNITYFQDALLLNGMALQAEQQLRLRPEDKINIVVNSSNPMLESQFTLTATNSRYMLGSSVSPQSTAGTTTGTRQMLAYTVDEQGTIDFPVLGKISVVGYRLQQNRQMELALTPSEELYRDSTGANT